MINPLDKYDFGARLCPSLVVLFPIELVCFSWVSKPVDLLKPLIGAGVGAGLSLLLANIARYYGKLTEPKLIEEWGGLPSTIMLRFSDNSLDTETKRRYHEVLGRLVPGAHIPTEPEEQADPTHADDVYKSCCKWLLEHTRDQKLFNLLFKENIYYGYHRNLFGLRPFGIAIALLGMIACFWKVIDEYRSHIAMNPISILCSLTALGFVLMWLFAINSRFVRQAGDAYAMRLLASCDVLGKGSPSETAAKPTSRKKKGSASDEAT